MSEEVLKALMQLFAILAKQDGGFLENHQQYVFDFLSAQLSVDRTKEYVEVYTQMLNESKAETSSTETAEVKRTSMKDSVRTLSICKKINKTLVQRQKLIVLTRLLEFFKHDAKQSVNRMQIVETVADVFKIEKTEFDAMRSFVFLQQSAEITEEILISSKTEDDKINCKLHVPHQNLDGVCRFLYLRSINLILVKYQGTSEIFLNGIVVKPQVVYLFPPGSTLRLPKGSVYFSSIISGFLEETQTEKFAFYAHIKKHQFPNGKVALNELKIGETSGNLVGVMGASGSGKTTLLTLLSGQESPSEGLVSINGKSIFKNKKELEGVIGFVPQDDLLIEDLTVYQNLYYNTRLCFKGLPEKELEEKISRVLVSLGLDEIKNTPVGSPLNKKISGGQRKRLNIALELIREPAVLFLDEPTSGLSSRDSENVMDLLKELTFRGKLIFVVIHQPSSDIFKMFDKMLILDTGGYAAFYGNPIESVMYFKRLTKQVNAEAGECYACGSVNPETIFNLIDLKELDEYGNYTTKRKMSPANFYAHYTENFLLPFSFEEGHEPVKKALHIPGIFGQIKLFFLRDLLSKVSNKQYILLNILEVPALALLLTLFIRFTDKSKTTTYTYFHNENIPAFFFMALLVGLLVGLTVSAEEIFKDQKILKREKFLHLSRFSYLTSKVILLFTLSLIQTVLFAAVGFTVLKVSGNYFSFGMILFSVFCSANLLGLVLSSTFNSPVTIYIIIPLIIIPQMVLGGAMFKFSKLNNMMGGGNQVPLVSNIAVTRWAYEAIATDMYINNAYESKKFNLDKMESKLNYKLAYVFPTIENLIGQSDTAKIKLSAAQQQAIISELTKQKTDAVMFGYKISADNVNIETAPGLLSELKSFYSEQFNKVEDLKREARNAEIKKYGSEEAYEQVKLSNHNSNLEEIVTNSFEKEKIEWTGTAFKQVIDPVFRDTEGNKMFGANTAFYSAKKFLFGKEIPTLWFNLLVIWLFNLLTFLILYFDLLKKLFSKIQFRKNTITS